MFIPKNSNGYLMRINTPKGIEFLNEHRKIIEDEGFVGICKFGGSKYKLDRLSSTQILVLIDTKINNNNSYIAKYTEVSESFSNSKIIYPSYYDSIERKKSLFFKVTEIKQIEFNILNEAFFVTSSRNSLDNVIKSICPNFFITSKYDLEF